MNQIALYFSPHASSVASFGFLSSLERSFFRHDLLIRKPKNTDELYQLLEKDLENNVKQFLTIGGDGTVNLVLQKLHPHDVFLYPFPGGTANDFSSELGLINNEQQLINILKHCSYKEVDVLNVNGKKFITSGGIGLAAHVGKEVNNYRNKIPLFQKIMSNIKGQTYSLLLVKQMLTQKLPVLELELKSPTLITPLRIKTPMLMINNQPSVGQDFTLAPRTKNNDGTFCVTIFKTLSKYELAKELISLRINGELSKASCMQFETEFLDINVLNGDQPFLIDGETLKPSNHFRISVEPTELKCYQFEPDAEYSTSYDLDQVEVL